MQSYKTAFHEVLSMDIEIRVRPKNINIKQTSIDLYIEDVNVKEAIFVNTNIVLLKMVSLEMWPRYRERNFHY